MRLHVRAPPGTRLEKTQQYFAEVEAQIRKLIGNDQIDVMLDNIGLPYSGINIALSDSATVGPMDGEILISLNEKHAPTAKIIAHAAPRTAGAVCGAAVLLSARRHRRPGAEFRPAGAHRCEGFGTGSGRRVCPGFADRARHDARPRCRRLACVSSPERAGADRGHGSRAGHADGRDAAGSGQQRAGRHQFECAVQRQISGSIRATASAIRWWCKSRPIGSARRRICRRCP